METPSFLKNYPLAIQALNQSEGMFWAFKVWAPEAPLAEQPPEVQDLSAAADRDARLRACDIVHSFVTLPPTEKEAIMIAIAFSDYIATLEQEGALGNLAGKYGARPARLMNELPNITDDSDIDKIVIAKTALAIGTLEVELAALNGARQMYQSRESTLAGIGAFVDVTSPLMDCSPKSQYRLESLFLDTLIAADAALKDSGSKKPFDMSALVKKYPLVADAFECTTMHADKTKIPPAFLDKITHVQVIACEMIERNVEDAHKERIMAAAVLSSPGGLDEAGKILSYAPAFKGLEREFASWQNNAEEMTTTLYAVKGGVLHQGAEMARNGKLTDIARDRFQKEIKKHAYRPNRENAVVPGGKKLIAAFDDVCRKCEKAFKLRPGGNNPAGPPGGTP